MFKDDTKRHLSREKETKSDLSADDLSQRSHGQRGEEPGDEKSQGCGGDRSGAKLQRILEP